MKQLFYSLLGRRNFKVLMNRLKQRKPYFAESEVILDYFSTYPRKGMMLDVGVHYGESFTEYIEMGWQVLGFEPDNDNIAKIPQHHSLTLLQKAVSDTDGQKVQLYRSDVSTGISSLAAFHSSHAAATEVSTITLRTALAQYNIRKVDFLKIDIEGYDFFALKGFPFESIQPEVILCEFEDFKTQPLGYTYKDMGDFLLQHGYAVWLAEWQPILKYGASQQWAALHSYPAPLQNERAWGNFIAVRTDKQANFEQILKTYMNFIKA